MWTCPLCSNITSQTPIALPSTPLGRILPFAISNIFPLCHPNPLSPLRISYDLPLFYVLRERLGADLQDAGSVPGCKAAAGAHPPVSHDRTRPSSRRFPNLKALGRHGIPTHMTLFVCFPSLAHWCEASACEGITGERPRSVRAGDRTERCFQLVREQLHSLRVAPFPRCVAAASVLQCGVRCVRSLIFNLDRGVVVDRNDRWCVMV